MRNKNTFIALVAEFVMVMASLGGCAGGGSKGNLPESSNAQIQDNNVTNAGYGNAGTGRFFESEIPVPGGLENINSLKKLADGSIVLAGSKKNGKKTGKENNYSYYIFKSTDKGQTWKGQEIKGLNGKFMPKAAIAPDGGVAIFDYAKDGKINTYISDTKGNTTSFSFGFPGRKDNSQVMCADYDAEKNLVVLDEEGSLFKLSSDGTCQKAFDTQGESVNYFYITGNTLVAVNDNGVLLFDASDGKMIGSEDVLDGFIAKNPLLASADTNSGLPMVFAEGAGDGPGSLFFANEEGIFHFQRGGSVAEQLVDGSLVSLGSGNIIFQGMAVIDIENFIIAAGTSAGCKLFMYSYDKKAKPAPDKEITVYALDESVFLRKAVSLFQKKNPDIHVNLDTGLSGNDGVTLEDALSVLSTNILAGKGPDVLILDGMLLDSYIEKGVLADISDIVEEIDKKEGIFPNIKKCSQKDGKIYAMPVRFLIPISEGRGAAAKAGESLSTLAKTVKQLKKKKPSVNAIPDKGTRTLLRDLYYADSASWQKEDGSLDENAVKEYLSYAKQIYDADSCSPEKDSQDKYFGDGAFEGEKVGTNQSSGLISNSCQMSFGTLASIYDLQDMISVQAQSKADYCIMNGSKTKSYVPYLVTGITENGNKEIAREFVKVLLGAKAGNSQLNGIPVNKTAYNEVITEKLDAQNVKDQSSVGFGGMDGDGKMYGYEFINLTENDIKKFTDIVDSLEKPSLSNRIIQEIILEQGSAYLLGEKNLDETTDTILKKVNLYLAE